jgi:hypothetical protein
VRPGRGSAANWGLTASRNTLLRLIRRAPLPNVATPVALGVGDWALRKRHTYGTVLESQSFIAGANADRTATAGQRRAVRPDLSAPAGRGR